MLKLVFKKLFSNGFTLIEVMVALFVLVSGVAVLLQVFPLGFSVEKSNQYRTQAVFLAQEKIESLLANSYNDIAVGDFVEQALPSPLTFFTRRTKVSYVNSDLQTIAFDWGLKKIEVVVSWSPAIALAKKEVQVITLATK